MTKSKNHIDPRKKSHLSAKQKETLSLLIDRMLSDEKPGGFSDGKKIALSIEGGGVAGVISAGVATAFHDIAILAKELQTNGGDFKASVKKLREHQINYNATEDNQVAKMQCFDGAWLSSAGAWTGMYLEASKPYNGTAIYFEDLTREIEGKKFINFPKGIKHYLAERMGIKNTPPGMDLKFLEASVTGKFDPTKAADLNRVMESGIPIHVVVTDFGDMKRKILTAKNAEELLSNSLAGTLVPGVAGKPEEGKPRYVDGKISGNSPIDMIPEDHLVIAIGSRPINSDPKHKGAAKVLDTVLTGFARVAVKNRREMKKVWELHETLGHDNNKLVLESQKDDRYVYFGTPEAYKKVSSSSQNEDELRKAAKIAYWNTIKMFREVMLEKGLILKNENEPVRMPYRWRKGLNPASSTPK